MSYTLKKNAVQRFGVQGAVLLYRQPTTNEYIQFKNAVIGEKALAEIDIEFADMILVDVEDFKYEADDGTERLLSRATRADELAHFEDSFGPIGSWKDVISPLWKGRLVQHILESVRVEEKN